MKTRREEFDRQISEALSQWSLPEGKTKKDIWENIVYSIRTKRESVFILKRWHWVAAACMASVLLSYAVFYSGRVVHSTFNNELKTIVLPDGSSVNMNSASTLNYNKYAWLFNRNVSLSGEGFFNVTKGSRFNVRTENGIIEVLGTSFNVYSRKNDFQVACYKGKVGVYNSNKSVVITPGEKIFLASNKEFVKSSIDKSLEKPQWISGVYSYSNTSLKNVFEEIERQYDVVITTDKLLESMKFTGEWSKTMPLNQVLEIVCLPFGLKSNLIEPGNYKIQARTL